MRTKKSSLRTVDSSYEPGLRSTRGAVIDSVKVLYLTEILSKQMQGKTEKLAHL